MLKYGINKCKSWNSGSICKPVHPQTSVVVFHIPLSGFGDEASGHNDHLFKEKNENQDVHREVQTHLKCRTKISKPYIVTLPSRFPFSSFKLWGHYTDRWREFTATVLSRNVNSVLHFIVTVQKQGWCQYAKPRQNALVEILKCFWLMNVQCKC